MSNEIENKKGAGSDMRIVGLMAFVLACTLPSIMNSGRTSSSYPSYAITHTGPKREFSEADAGWYEYVYSSDEAWHCGTILKWRAAWMPKGYQAELLTGADNTTHTFKTLGEAEEFLHSRNCPIGGNR